ncbi:MAG: hypothetical protein WCR95_02310 [Eubacteriales bacterium]
MKRSRKAGFPARVFILSFSFILAAAFLLFSCGKSNETPVMNYNGKTVSTGLFAYMLSSQKAYVKDTFSRNTADHFAKTGEYLYGTNDFEEFLSKTFINKSGDTVTYAENAFLTVLNTAKMFVVADKLCGDYNLKIVDGQTLEDIEEIISGDIEAAGGKVYLEDILTEYGADIETEREYLLLQAKVDLLYDYLYGKNGSQRIADSVISDIFYEQYKKIDFLFYSFYSDSEVGDPSPDSPQRKEEKINAAKDFLAEVTSGETSFEDYKTHDGFAVYDKGLCFTEGMLEENFANAVSTISSPRGVVFYQSDDGVYLIRLLTPDDNDFLAYYDDIYKPLSKNAFYDFLESYYPEVSLSQETLDKYNFVTIKPLEVS